MLAFLRYLGAMIIGAAVSAVIYTALLHELVDPMSSATLGVAVAIPAAILGGAVFAAYRRFRPNSRMRHSIPATISILPATLATWLVSALWMNLAGIPDDGIEVIHDAIFVSAVPVTMAVAAFFGSGTGQR